MADATAAEERRVCASFSYNIFKRWIMKRIAAKAGGETDTSHDYDYTDWADLRAFTHDFRRRLTAAA